MTLLPWAPTIHSPARKHKQVQPLRLGGCTEMQCVKHVVTMLGVGVGWAHCME